MPSLPQINFKFPLDDSTLGMFDMNTNTKDAIREDLKLTILTSVGERVISDVGSMYKFDVFKQTKQEVQAAITSHTDQIFKNFFPFLQIDDLQVMTSDDNSAIQDYEVYVKLIYSFKGVQGFSDEILFAL